MTEPTRYPHASSLAEAAHSKMTDRARLEGLGEGLQACQAPLERDTMFTIGSRPISLDITEEMHGIPIDV
jgi:hypothetical protein